MKRIIALALTCVMAIGLLAACGGNGGSASGSVKVGLGVVTSIGSSKDLEGDKGTAQVDSTIATVAVDENGKIVDCQIDAAQTKVTFDAAGKITSDKSAEIKSKNELGTDYNMKGNSDIKKEWNEQAEAFAQWCIGKTVDEVKNLPMKDGIPNTTDLVSSVTIHVGDFITAIEKAVANAK